MEIEYRITALPGQKFNIMFEKSEKGGVIAASRVNNKISFPQRNGQQPKAGEIWEVELVGTNPTGTVNFLKMMRLISTEESRVAARNAETERKNAQRNRDQEFIKSRMEMVKEALVPLMPIPYGTRVPLEGKLEGFVIYGDSVKVQILSTDSVKGVEAKIIQSLSVEFGIGGVRADLEFNYFGWNLVKKSVWCHTDLESKTLTPSFTLMGRELNIPYPAHLSRVYWEKVEMSSYSGGQIQYSVKQSIVANTPLGDVVSEETVWQEPQRDQIHPAWDNTQVAVAMAEIEADKAKGRSESQALQEMGLLMFSSSSVYSALKSAGLPVGWAPYGESHYVIHPSLKVIFEGADSDSCTIAPLTMNDPRNGIDPWTKIEWANGGPAADLDKVTAFMAATKSEQVGLSEQEFAAWVAENTSEIEVEVFGSDPASGFFTYRIKFFMPFKIVEFHDLDGIRINRGSRIELREATIEEAGLGNREFVGKLPATLQYKYSGRSKARVNNCFFAVFEIPKTEEEMKREDEKAWESFVSQARDYQVVLSGWRYSDTGNPIVYFRNSSSGVFYWTIQELIIEDGRAPSFGFRKGSGSRKANVTTFDRRSVVAAMGEYASFDWPVEEDRDLPFGQSLLGFLGFEG